MDPEDEKDIRTIRPKNTFLRRRYRKQKQGILDVLAEMNDNTNMIQTKNPGILEAIREVKEMSLIHYLRVRHEAHLKHDRPENSRSGDHPAFRLQ